MTRPVQGPTIGAMVIIVFLVGVGFVLVKWSAKQHESTTCARAAADPKSAHRDILRDCRLDENGRPTPLTREERRSLGLE
jgi:hypothetical protein